LHPYTKALLGAVPVPDPVIEAGRSPQIITGEVPSVRNPPPGCRFHTRCPQAMPECRLIEPPLRPLAEGGAERRVACHLYPESAFGHPDPRAAELDL
jgi:oligopeptide transport system ATP-binding protein